MSESDALLAAIRQAPEDDAPRLIYADWLDEHGQPERAEFIRVQIELARRDSPALRQREAELLAEHHDAFAEPLAAPGLRYRFHRGFIVGFGHTGLFKSEQRGGRSRAWTYIRFLPDGSLALFVISAEPEVVVDLIRRMEASAHNVYFATYHLDTFDTPTLRIFFTEEDAIVDLSGVFQGRTFCLDKFDPREPRRTRKDYVHVPINGYDSFSESP